MVKLAETQPDEQGETHHSTFVEIIEAVGKCNNDKSPGTYGILREFYKSGGNC